uniref:Cystatin domain-containing protein n=1 Tax=Tetranychus urticae TaxID=32264 RepID=T1K3D0_TETUR
MKLIIFTCLFAAVWTNESGQISETTLIESEDDFRQAPAKNLFGPWVTVPVDDPIIQKYTEQALERQNKEFGDRYKRLVSINQAKRQTLSGYRFEIEMIIRETDCNKNDPKKHQCQFNSARAPEPVVFDVWVKGD